MNPRVAIVTITKDDYQLEIEFTNGEVGVYDCALLLDFGVFRELRDIDYFKQARAKVARSSGRTSKISARIRSTKIR